MLLEAAEKIQGSGYKPDVIVGVAKGGLVPARVLCDLLETQNLAIIQIEYYVGINQTKAEPTLKQCLSTQISGKKVLLVDDISDGGKTLQLAKKHLADQGAAEIKIATIYMKPTTLTPPDYCGKQTRNWVVFPWDAKETVKTIIQRQGASGRLAKKSPNL